ncbi:unnamed protein product [Notodromas monacha]|uniref:Uncharacterized protein n=1 Tax=Notodromas monacha TaxID=399045 RepID=A0A7R9GJ78_9CRUS|nr:unnamed protein product [Notodromas monacha]CAG0922582.1 unnamed protein product [Notodromas monacha]
MNLMGFCLMILRGSYCIEDHVGKTADPFYNRGNLSTSETLMILQILWDEKLSGSRSGAPAGNTRVVADKSAGSEPLDPTAAFVVVVVGVSPPKPSGGGGENPPE